MEKENKNETENFLREKIGTVVEVTTPNGVKEILVKDVFTNQSGKCLIEDSEANIYSEDDINWAYKLTLGACLMVWLDKFGYLDMEEAFGEDTKKYEAQLEDLFNLLIKQGYIEKKEEKDTAI